MFHIQLRQFPNVSREFNLTAEELRQRILGPWLAGAMVDSGDRRWAPERARLTIYEGPELRPEEIGMGRGWQNVTRRGKDVTAAMMSASAGRGSPSAGRGPGSMAGSGSALALLKARIADRCRTAGALEVRDSVRLAGEVAAGSRVSERVALAEQAIWELLHEGVVALALAGGVHGEAGMERVDPGEWQPVLLSWRTWGGDSGGGGRVFVEVP